MARTGLTFPIRPHIGYKGYLMIQFVSVTVLPAVKTCTFSIPVYIVVTNPDVTVTPAVKTCTFSIPAYTVAITGDATILAPVLVATFTVLVYSVRGDYWQDKFIQPTNAWSNKFT